MTQLDRALADLEAAQKVVQGLLASARRFPEEFPIGTVLAFKKQFSGPTSKVYGYVALRASNGEWYTTTGGRAQNIWTWDELVEFIGDSPCSIAKEWEDI